MCISSTGLAGWEEGQVRDDCWHLDDSRRPWDAPHEWNATLQEERPLLMMSTTACCKHNDSFALLRCPNTWQATAMIDLIEGRRKNLILRMPEAGGCEPLALEPPKTHRWLHLWRIEWSQRSARYHRRRRNAIPLIQRQWPELDQSLQRILVVQV